MSIKNKIGFGIIICLSSVLGVASIVDLFIEVGIAAGMACLAIVSLLVTGLVLITE
ncbi:hypothetical protein [Lactiplantibacillus plantarum]|uniref:hypothetical protein n=1 Tax=Lactiplantibacillus plantarum TaxID=1590 RepID=UPI000B1C7459|nr:hypothetical protein [Lactiplantibacillus plantarum]